MNTDNYMLRYWLSPGELAVLDPYTVADANATLFMYRRMFCMPKLWQDEGDQA